MTWLSTFYLRAFVVLLQIILVRSDDYGPLPGFKQQPIDTLIESINQSIVCNIYGEKPSISWRKDNVELDTSKLKYITISTEGSLNIFNTQRGRDEGNYRCVVENKYGRVLSRSAKVTFPYMNLFSVEVTRIDIEEGQSALLLGYVPDSYPDRHIYWLKEERSLQIDANSHFSTSIKGDLYFSYTKQSDKGSYSCRVDNSKLKRFENRNVYLNVIPVTRQKNIAPGVWSFGDHIAMKDSNFVLECISYGRPIPVMKFRNVKTGAELIGSQQFGNRLRYEFGRFTSQHQGEYKCEVLNAYGQKDSKTAYIKIEGKPEMSLKSRDIEAAVDSFIEMPCVAHGIPSVKYEWYFNGFSLTGSKEVKIHQGNLTIHSVMKYHQGFYQCVAYNKHGEDLLTIHFTVVEIPASFGVYSTPPAQSTQALVGGTAEITCVPSGAPKPSVTWRKLNSSVDIITDERFTILLTGTLKIINIKRSDAGKYECVASNKLRTARRTGELKVNGGLAITEPLTTNENVPIGSKIILRCKYSSYEKIEIPFQWYFGRSRIRNSDRIKITKANKQSVLVIDNAKFTDTGRYKCRVVGTKRRSAEKVQMIIIRGPTDPEPVKTQRPPYFKTTTLPYKDSTKLTIRGPPQHPLDVTANELSGLNIKISWTMGRDNGADATRVYIQARTTFDLDFWHTIKISNKTQRSRESEIVQLSPWVEYKIRIISENKYGKSKPSVETSKWVRTPTAKPTLYPTNIQGNGTGPNELKISFDPLPDIDQNAPGIGYIVHYRAKGSSYQLVSRDVPKGQNYIKLNFLNTDSDSYYKPYEFQVQSKNDAGLGPRSPLYIAYTGERVPIAVPTNLRVKLTDQNNAVALWDDISRTRSSLRGTFLGYKFVYWVSPDENTAEIQEYFITSLNTISIRLAPYTKYYFQVLAYNNAGDGPRSTIFGPLTTPEGVPSKPANFKVVDATLGEITLTWNEPLQKNGIINKYLITYYSTPSDRSYMKKLSGDERMLTLKNLQKNKKYIIKIAAVTNAGVSEESEVSFDLSRVPKMKLEAPIVKSIGYNAIVLTWISASEDSEISGYKLFFWKAGGSEVKAVALWEQTNDIVTTVHSLSAGTTYFFQIAVVNKYGTGPRSGITKTETKVKINTAPESDKASSSIKLNFSNYVITILILTAILIPR